jgi:hypothetical protein
LREALKLMAPGRVGDSQLASRPPEPPFCSAAVRTGPPTGQAKLPVLRTSKKTTRLPVRGTTAFCVERTTVPAITPATIVTVDTVFGPYQTREVRLTGCSDAATTPGRLRNAVIGTCHSPTSPGWTRPSRRLHPCRAW